ncbi:MAG: NFACT family protein [Clostridia bacterium]|nr:NFACT family protein [Clostridia bacterium]
MPFDAIAVSAVLNECEKNILGGKIEKIHQPEKDEIRLYIKNAGKQFILLFCASPSLARIQFTESKKPNPIDAPLFCMLLRKHLGGGRVVSVTQHFFDRILDVGIEATDELGDKKVKHLIVEIMSRQSNIILVSDGKVIDSIRRVDISLSAARSILPGITYRFPPVQDKLNPMEADYDAIFEKLLSFPKDILIEKAVLSGFRGTSPAFGREIAFRATDSVDTRLDGTNIKKVCEILFDAFKDIKAKRFSPEVITCDGKTIDFNAYNISYYSKDDIESFDTLSEAMDSFFYLRDMQERIRQKSASVRKVVSNALTRCRKKLSIQQDKLAETENADKWRIYGDILTANLYKLSGGESIVLLENYYEDGLPKIEIPLDKTKSPQKNAEMYYKKYRKAKTAKTVTEEQIKKNIAEIEYLESVQNSIEISETEEDLNEIRRELSENKYIREEKNNKKQKRNTEKSEPLKFEFEGYEIFVGRNNKQNDYVTLKIAKTYDIWLHVKDSPGSHVVIKNKGTEIPDGVIEYAASLAAYYSSLREQNKAAVDYCRRKNVKKPGGAMPGKVIYENYKTAYVTPRKE